MKCVILAGGYGTRISEESHLKPKPMIEIGGMPILWHIMKYFSAFGIDEFIICAGYKQEIIKEFFANYALKNSDITFNFSSRGAEIIHSDISEPWTVTVVDTGLDTMTGGRIKRIQKFVKNETFLMTYGDGLSDVNLTDLINFHRSKNVIVTLTGIQPEGRFGVLDIDDNNRIKSFREKDKEDAGWINGGFMVCEPEIFNHIEGDRTVFEKEPLEGVIKQNKLFVFKHHGFWQCMDTLREKERLEYLLKSNLAPWKIW